MPRCPQLLDLRQPPTANAVVNLPAEFGLMSMSESTNSKRQADIASSSRAKSRSASLPRKLGLPAKGRTPRVQEHLIAFGSVAPRRLLDKLVVTG